MDLFGVLSFVHDVEGRMSDTATLFEEYLTMRDIMDRMLGDLQTGDNLSIRITEIDVFRNRFLVLPVRQK